MKLQRRILPPHSSNYLEMEEYPVPISNEQRNSMDDSTSDLSEIESVCSVSNSFRQRSDSLTNLFHLSEDNTSVSNLSLASFSQSQRSMDNHSPTIQNFSTEKNSRTRRSVSSLTNHSQKSLSIKTNDTVLTSRAVHPMSSDKCGLIANDANDLDQADDPDGLDDVESRGNLENFDDSMDDQDLEMIATQSNRRFKKTVLNNVDRFLTSTNKQIKL